MAEGQTHLKGGRRYGRMVKIISKGASAPGGSMNLKKGRFRSERPDKKNANYIAVTDCFYFWFLIKIENDI